MLRSSKIFIDIHRYSLILTDNHRYSSAPSFLFPSLPPSLTNSDGVRAKLDRGVRARPEQREVWRSYDSPLQPAGPSRLLKTYVVTLG